MPQALPILMIAGLAATGVGTVMQMNAASKNAEAQQDIARQQQAAEAVRQRAMELDAQRKQMENIRQMQKARAMALSTTTAQGASFGSGLSGSYGGISGVGNTNALGISQGAMTGEQMFGINSNISQDRYNMAGYSADAAMGSGLSSLGGAVMSSMGNIEKFSQGFGNIFGSPSGGVNFNTPNQSAWYYRQ